MCVCVCVNILLILCYNFKVGMTTAPASVIINMKYFIFFMTCILFNKSWSWLKFWGHIFEVYLQWRRVQRLETPPWRWRTYIDKLTTGLQLDVVKVSSPNMFIIYFFLEQKLKKNKSIYKNYITNITLILILFISYISLRPHKRLKWRVLLEEEEKSHN